MSVTTVTRKRGTHTTVTRFEPPITIVSRKGIRGAMGDSDITAQFLNDVIEQHDLDQTPDDISDFVTSLDIGIN